MCRPSPVLQRLNLIDSKVKLFVLIQINQPIRCNSFTSLLLGVYVWLNMLRAPPRPSLGACKCINSLWFTYSSTCFGRPHTLHQELNNCSSSLWLYRWSVVVVVPARPRTTALLPPSSNGKTRGCYGS